MALKSSERRYGVVAMTLHWLIAFAIIGNFALGFYIHELTISQRIQRFNIELFQVHKSIGLTILALSLLRLFWRMVNPVPALPEGLPGWERVAARASHVLLYVLMIGIPFSGWALVSLSPPPLDVPTYWFKQFEVPHLPITDLRGEAAKDAALVVHAYLAFAMAGLFVLHVMAALRHHLILKNDVLKRMIPGTRVS
jgi:cytochrome b561